MNIRFNCHCGARLKCSVRSIGTSKVCPACKQLAGVPVPSPDRVRRFIGEVEPALPGESSEAYLKAASSIVERAETAFALASASDCRIAVAGHLDDAVRVLRNIRVFLPDEHADEKASKMLQSLAASANFGGIGCRKSKLASFRRWQSANRTIENSLAPFIDDCVQRVKSMLNRCQ
ncbi:hypothetical protein NHH03_21120 [Stieleria sp. TO1_6]|nr:hypothetical protein [Stieleria tagensis]